MRAWLNCPWCRHEWYGDDPGEPYIVVCPHCGRVTAERTIATTGSALAYVTVRPVT